jgi:hypothetical protein
MAGKRRNLNNPSPGPSSRRKLSPSDDPMTVDSSMAASTGSHFLDDVLTYIANICKNPNVEIYHVMLDLERNSKKRRNLLDLVDSTRYLHILEC